MDSFLSDSQKNSLEDTFDGLAKTFERPIVIYREAEKIFIATDNFNRFQANNQNIDGQNPQNVPQYFTINARIKYETKQGIAYTNSAPNEELLKLIETDGRVRIKVNQSGYALMADVKRFSFDNFNFKLESLVRPHGLFNNKYYTFVLQRET